MATRYTEQQKQALIAEYEASGLPLSTFCKGKGNKPGSQMMAKWMKGAGTSARQVSSNAVGRDSALFAQFTQSLLPDDVQAKYIAYLEKRVRDLEDQLASQE